MWQDYNRPTPQQDEQSLAEMPQLIPIIIVEVHLLPEKQGGNNEEYGPTNVGHIFANQSLNGSQNNTKAMCGYPRCLYSTRTSISRDKENISFAS